MDVEGKKRDGTIVLENAIVVGTSEVGILLVGNSEGKNLLEVPEDQARLKYKATHEDP